jgi:hypothetical protein
MKTRTIRKIASWKAGLRETTFPQVKNTFKSYRFVENKGWVLVAKGELK